MQVRLASRPHCFDRTSSFTCPLNGSQACALQQQQRITTILSGSTGNGISNGKVANLGLLHREMPVTYDSSPRLASATSHFFNIDEGAWPTCTQRCTAAVWRCAVYCIVFPPWNGYVILAVMPFATESDSTPSARLAAHHAPSRDTPAP